MNRCLRCNEPRSETSLFCERCQSSLLNRSQEREKAFEVLPLLAQSVPQAQELVQGETQIRPEPVVKQKIAPANRSTKLATTIAVTTGQSHQRVKHLRIGFMVLTILAILALIVDLVLVLLVLTHVRHLDRVIDGHAIAALALNTASRGQVVSLHLSHFSPSAQAYITHDVQEPVQIEDNASSFVEIGATGRADVAILIGENWSAGPHILQVEDSETHAIASTTVEVAGAGPIVSPQLEVSATSLKLERATSMQLVQLHNAGSGIVTWSASSPQSWLKVTPERGAFSSSQVVEISVSRSDLKPGEYRGAITFAPSLGSARKISITIEVSPTQNMLAVDASALTLTAIDGEADIAAPLVPVRNRSMHPVHISLMSSVTGATMRQKLPSPLLNWLEMEPVEQEIAPLATESIHVHVHSHNLLAGTYSGILTLNSDQKAPALAIALSLIVRPPCGVISDIGSISSAVVAQPGRTSSQKLGLHTLPDCSGAMNWQAFSTTSWLTVTPDEYQMQEKGSMVTTVSVNGSTLQPGTYNGSLIFIGQRFTHTVSVQLAVLSATPAQSLVPGGTAQGGGGNNSPQATVQATPGSGPVSTPTSLAADRPGLSVAATNLTFNVMQGQSRAFSQSVTLTNTGGGMLHWSVSGNTQVPAWLNFTPASDGIVAGQSEQMQVGIDANGIAPGVYSATLVVMATDSNGLVVQGSPQEVAVTLNVLSPCTLQVTPSTLTFATSLLQPQPPDQSITIKEAGDCARPVTWKATVDGSSRNWLLLTAQGGNDRGSGSTETVSVNAKGLLPNTYTGQITILAYTSDGTAAMTQMVAVKLISGI